MQCFKARSDHLDKCWAMLTSQWKNTCFRFRSLKLQTLVNNGKIISLCQKISVKRLITAQVIAASIII